ncbi:hypothetical protein RMCBS344292_18809 [Rhizopus microsporus]|nr:hypothetical protein RMCBS344292_18809 [Rhizopus microsporus]
MSNAIVANVYRYVIDEVINQVRGDFEDMGIDESVLQELQRVRYHNYSINLILTVIKSWESKVARSRVANFGFIRDEPFYDDEHSDMPAPSSNGVHANDNVDNNSHPILQYPHNQDYNQNATSAPSVASLANLAASNSRLQQQQQQQQPNFVRIM